jgi:hypothetical protein
VISALEELRKRFVDTEADRRRKEMVDRIKGAGLTTPGGVSTIDLLRELRGS